MGTLFDLVGPDGGKLEGDIQASIRACNPVQTIFGVTRAQSQLFKRDARRVARDGMDHILVQVFLQGGGVTEDGTRVEAGDMLIIDLDQPHAMVNTDFANLTLVLPRDMHPRLTAILGPLHATRLSSENPMVALLAAHLGALWDLMPTMDSLQADAAIQGSLGLMEAWLSRDGLLVDGGEETTWREMDRSIRRHIDRNLCEPLTVESLLHDFRVSRTQLYRLFAANGGVARYIQDRRLRASWHLLCQPSMAHRGIGEIAFSFWFSSQAQFSKAFKSRFGVTPSQARAEALETLTRDSAGDGATVSGSGHFADWVKSL